MKISVAKRARARRRPGRACELQAARVDNAGVLARRTTLDSAAKALGVDRRLSTASASGAVSSERVSRRLTMRSSLHTRLRVGLGAIAVALALLSIAAVLSLNRLGGAIETVLKENYVSVVASEDMKEALERLDSAALFAGTGREDIAGPMLQKNRKAFVDALAVEQASITLPGEGELVHRIEEGYGAYTDAVDRVLAMPPEARSTRYFGDLLPRFMAVKDSVQAVLQLNQDAMVAADRAGKQLAQSTVCWALAISIGAVLFTAWFVFWLPRVIVGPVRGMTQTITAIGEGNLAVDVVDPGVEELAPLAEAFNKMLVRLRAYRESSLGELLAAKDLARATLECMLDPVVVFDRDGGVRLANEAAEEAFELRVGSAEELRAAAVKTPAELADARDRVLATGAPVLPRSLSEAMAWRAPEGERHYLVRAAPLHGEKEGGSAIVVAQDVTRFRRIDELKSDMVATVSHEFKTPLTSLRMATHLLLESGTGPLTESQRELVTTARDDTERLRAMVEDLLDVVRIESEAGALHRVPVEPFGLLCEVADAHRTVAKDKGVTLRVETKASQGLVSVDPERISIALANLVSNAVRHTPSGGNVTLEASRDERELHVRVMDDGEGIAPSDLHGIFDRAPSSSPVTDGTPRHGLGLTIAREIVLQHGGELLAESTPGKGSVFTMVLPIDSVA
jgi:two-component system, NtrC family, sensor histidine kinase KinB